mgnify:CR=1 FL=1
MSTLKVNAISDSAGANGNAITLASDGKCAITGSTITADTGKFTNLPNRNLIINGAMQVAQRGTSTSSGSPGTYATVDRFSCTFYGTNEAITQAQHTLTSSDTGPWAKGFRNSFHLTNGDQDESTAVAGDQVMIVQYIEAQNIANSGWDYTSASSYITLSFWVKSSVAQNFYGHLEIEDGTAYNYPFETGSLSADTWTKITKTIPGNSNITIDNNNGRGLNLYIIPFIGTDFTATPTLNTWATYASGTRTPDNTSTWYYTDDATFEITGVQLEVGDTATEFEHRLYGDELARCQRYYYRHATGADGSGPYSIGPFACYAANDIFGMIDLPVTMRANPTLDQVTGTDYYKVYSNSGSDAFNSFGAVWNPSPTCIGLNANSTGGVSGRTAGHATFVRTDDTNAYLAFSAEL